MPDRPSPTRRRPPRRGVTPARVVAIAATGALLVIAIAIASMILAAGGDDEQEAAVPTQTPTPTPSASPTPTPTPRPQLTGEQRRQRRDAVAEVRRQGYEVVALRDYKPRNTLRVLLGERPIAAGGGLRAFFFVDGTFVGTDSQTTSAVLRASRFTSASVTLTYGIFEAGDAPCCPSGTQRVKFRWDGGQLRSDQLPPAPGLRAPRSG